MTQPSSYAELAEGYAKREREQTAVGPLGNERTLFVERFFQEIDGLCGRTTGIGEFFFRVYNPDAHCVMVQFKCKDGGRAISVRRNDVENSHCYIGEIYTGESFEFCVSFDFINNKSISLACFSYEGKLPLFWGDYNTDAGIRQYFSGRGSKRDQPLSDWSHIPLDGDEMSFTMNEEHHERICEAYQHFLVWSNDICKTRTCKNLDI